MGFWNLVIDTLSDVKTTENIGWVLSFWHHGIKNKTVIITWCGPPDLPRESAPGADRSGRWLPSGLPLPVIPLGKSGGPYHVTTQFYYFASVLNNSNVSAYYWYQGYLIWASCLHIYEWLLSFLQQKSVKKNLETQQFYNKLFYLTPRLPRH